MKRLRMIVVVAVALSVPAIAGAQSKQVKAKARQHSNQGEMYMQAGVYDLAIKEYQVAYKLVPKAHGFLFNIGLAYEKWDKKPEALAAYKQFLNKAPKHSKAAETSARMIALERKIAAEKEAAGRRIAEEAARRRAAQMAAAETTAAERAAKEQAARDKAARDKAARDKAARDKAARDKAAQDQAAPERAVTTQSAPGQKRSKKKKQLSWGWVAAGTAVVLGGVFMDWGPPDARDGELDGTDFIPVALYGVGGFFLYKGVF